MQRSSAQRFNLHHRVVPGHHGVQRLPTNRGKVFGQPLGEPGQIGLVVINAPPEHAAVAESDDAKGSRRLFGRRRRFTGPILVRADPAATENGVKTGSEPIDDAGIFAGAQQLRKFEHAGEELVPIGIERCQGFTVFLLYPGRRQAQAPFRHQHNHKKWGKDKCCFKQNSLPARSRVWFDFLVPGSRHVQSFVIRTVRYMPQIRELSANNV